MVGNETREHDAAVNVTEILFLHLAAYHVFHCQQKNKTWESEPPSVRLKENHKKQGLPTSQQPQDYHVPGRPQECFLETVLGHWDMTCTKLSIRPIVKEGEIKRTMI